MKTPTIASVLAFSCLLSSGGETPKVLDPDFALTLFAREPDIVTPVGATFDNRGRLLVIESHTHFRPKGYQRPPADRIRIVEDRDGDGKADTFATLHEGFTHAMAIATAPDGSIYVATRAKIVQLIEGADGVQEKEIARLDTPGAYPHNGLCGLAFDAEGRLWFGLGENLGKPYKLIASDGAILEGGGEGGNIYACNADGSGLERIATGFWNPFGICHDPEGRVFTVDNDPDKTPYCRLLHVVPGADFGYQFRYGRSGKHPLQAWEAELPGTLPIVAPTGEAPCAVLAFEGRLWVTSCWNFRIERYALEPSGASWKATRENVVEGDQWFRPVDFAQAPDGSLFVTDWAHASYPLHGRGRIWRLARKKGRPADPAQSFPGLAAEEQRAHALREGSRPEALATEDRFLWLAAAMGLKESDLQSWDSQEDARVRLGMLAAARWRFPGRRDAFLEKAFHDGDADVQLAAVRWASDEKVRRFAASIESIGSKAETGSPLAKAAAAALEYLRK